MELNEYQGKAILTAIYPNDGNISYLALELCRETGELADKVKKVLRDNNGQIFTAELLVIAL